ncbi:PREDICTED: putative uncharacterized protein C14orf25-like [Elephantulus edwardii]|uniref:putative uncharacterized protein C14orf25-like n=1 Tax=Elephantulus edwardii TaxID=28737 RepID=UPI0003F09DDC|nr:PREDICTED: putative uncharacterized protein C14orf25-like [Elephantulus edwardii]
MHNGESAAFIKMALIPKHFGLKDKEESYVRKELEKVRKETRTEFLRFKQRLASQPTLEKGLFRNSQQFCRPRPRERKRISHVSFLQPFEFPSTQVPMTPVAALPQEALQGSPSQRGLRESVSAQRRRPFCPQDFYMRSSAFLRYQLQKIPPAIAPGAGTSKQIVLLPVRVPPPKVRRVSGSAQHSASSVAFDLTREHDAVPEVSRSREHSKAEAWALLRKLKILTHTSRKGRASLVQEVTQADVHKTDMKRVESVSKRQLGQLRARAIPTTIEEVIASLHSEAERAADQTIIELIQSVLGPDFDIKVEDVSLMGKTQWPKTSQTQFECGLQISVEEQQTESQLEELPETTSSIFQIEQEDILDWEASEADSMILKQQDGFRVHPTEESRHTLLGDEKLTYFSKAAKQMSRKVSSSEFLQIKGKEMKRFRKSKYGFYQRRLAKSFKFLGDKKVTKR